MRLEHTDAEVIVTVVKYDDTSVVPPSETVSVTVCPAEYDL